MSDEFYGAPKLALKWIAANVIAWAVLLSGYALLSGVPVERIPVFAVYFIGAMMVYIALLFAYWKLYWWVMAIGMTCGTVALLGLIVAVLSGAVVLSR